MSTWVRIQGKDGIRITNAIAVPVVPQNPGIFGEEGTIRVRPWRTTAAAYASGLISIDGTPKENDALSITIARFAYIQLHRKEDDTLAIIRDAFIQLINDNAEEEVTATAAGIYTRIVLRAKIPGPEGQGLKYTATGTDSVLLTAITTQLCCASQEGARITENDPAVPGETITIYATGLGWWDRTKLNLRRSRVPSTAGRNLTSRTRLSTTRLLVAKPPTFYLPV